MPERTPSRNEQHTRPADLPRPPPAKEGKGSLGWVKSVLGRSISLEQRRNQLHVVLVDPKRRSVSSESPLDQMRGELRTRLLVHDPATQTVRNLVFVHEALGRNGWAAVETLLRPVLAKALAEAEMLDSQDPTPLMAMIVERLREIGVTADMRAEHEALQRAWETPAVPEVSEGSHEEYERMERSWIGTVPDDLE